MNLTKDIEIIDLSLYLKKYKILIISDLHIGFEEALNKQGVFIPRLKFKRMLERLKNITSKLKIEKIIINGDLKHEFGKISEQEWNDTLKFIDSLKAYEIILVKGNHDTILEPIAKKRNIKIVDYYKIDDILILHGDEIVEDKEIKTIIIGHEHPAISFPSRKDEKFKCFLLGKYKNKDLIVMPSMNLVTEGIDITKDKLLSPFLKDISNFKIYIIEDKVYDFGVLKNIKNVTFAK